jgi:acetylornithine deacetylase/succinyl-diaminopimelate desuccinylase-like protein
MLLVAKEVQDCVGEQLGRRGRVQAEAAARVRGFRVGVTLANTPGLRMRVFANTLRQTLPTANVIAEKTGANDNNVVMAGAHLDSVLAGPGINDNGSGSAAILEAAEQLAHVDTRNTLRFAWWAPRRAGSSARRTTSTA